MKARGFTLAELLITVALFGLIALAAAPMMKLTQSGFSSLESSMSMKTEGQKVINTISEYLTECKRIFENNANDLAYLARVPLTGGPNLLTGSKLPSIEEIASITPSSSTFVAASVGNSIFFASLGTAVDCTVLDGGGATVSARIDSYIFNYYYLGYSPNKQIGNQRQIDLWEFHSVNYADYNQISGILDSTKKTNVIKYLYNTGGYRTAWDPAATNSSAAFYSLTAGGAMSLSATHTIVKNKIERSLNIVAGQSGASFHYGISPNTGSGFTSSVTVPIFGTAAAKFPSGFEVVVVGPNSSRQVFIRMVMAAQGGANSIVASETTQLTAARDLW